MTRTVEFAVGRLPLRHQLEELRHQAKQLQAEEIARLFRRFLADINRITKDGLDPRVYADKVNPPRRYSSAYF
jgi:hypothetical protein